MTSRTVPLRRGRRDRLLDLADHLTERDREILHTLARFRVLTTHQVRDLAYTHIRRAEIRLAELYRLGAVDRFRPVAARGAGSNPYHWMLSSLGFRVVAADRGVPVRQIGLRPEQRAHLATSMHRLHHVEAAGFATALIRTARRRPGCDLAWLTQWECTERWGRFARPDGYGTWTEPAGSITFFLEYDRGTENPARLAAKLNDYADLADALPDPLPWLLFTAPDPNRETIIRRAVTQPRPLPTATAVYHPRQSPTEAIWTPLDTPQDRVPLAALPSID